MRRSRALSLQAGGCGFAEKGDDAWIAKALADAICKGRLQLPSPSVLARAAVRSLNAHKPIQLFIKLGISITVPGAGASDRDLLDEGHVHFVEAFHRIYARAHTEDGLRRGVSCPPTSEATQMKLASS